AGILGEHSPCDALILSIIVDYSIAEHVDTAQFGEHTNLEPGLTKAWDELEWVVDEKVKAEIPRTGRCEEVDCGPPGAEAEERKQNDRL
ncbi:hypothetical protein M407DRAFT_241711, partial [Tulasnella calospora MUT 4182]